MIYPPKYDSFEAKEKYYLDNKRLENSNDLNDAIESLKSCSRSFIYRGVCDAAYKMYTSAQRYWIDGKGAQLKDNDFANYADYLQKLIDRSREIKMVEEYRKEYNVHYNEMWLLALMQHYLAPSVMLDFTHDINSGLYFMCDGAGVIKGDGSLSDYVSLYFMDSKVDWIQATAQNLMTNCVCDIRKNIIPKYGTDKEIYDNILDEIDRLPARKYLSDKVDFICIEGPVGGSVSVDIPELNFHTSYDIINGRLMEQSGMFFADFSETEPFVELLFKAETPKESIFNSDGSVVEKDNPQDATKHIHCWNVNKCLIPSIQKQYLEPLQLDKDKVYRAWSEDDRLLEEEMKRTHFVQL